MVQAAVFGFGTVGSGVVEVFETNAAQVARTIPGGMYIKYILDIRDFPDSPYGGRIVHDIDVILSDPEIKVVCETMGGKEPAFTFTKRALEKGISVCTSNKELVAAHGPELLEIARQHQCSYLFEAAVGGGIPLITPMLKCLAQEEITSVIGILNGTTNFILTNMEKKGASFEDELKMAQELGYAERNPVADIEAHDPGRKISILSSLMTGKTVPYEKIHLEGIKDITPEDFAYAHAAGCTIKLLGIAKMIDEKVSVLAAPHLIPEGHPLYSVSGVFNAALVHGNTVDDVMFYGRGAGKLPTGSAVAADMVYAARHMGETIEILWDIEEADMTDFAEQESRFFVRTDAAKREKAEALFAGKIARVLHADGVEGEYAFLTEPIAEGTFEEKEQELGIKKRIRVY